MRNKYIYFFSASEIQNINKNGSVEISVKNLHHLRNVLRRSFEVNLIASDGKGHFADAKLRLDQRIELIGSWSQKASLRTPKISLMTVIIKKQKMEWLIQKASELGVDYIYLIDSNRQNKDYSLRSERMQIIVEDACRQAQNLFLPEIIRMTGNISEITKNKRAEQYYFWGIYHASQSISNLSWDTTSIKEIIFINGPEGGWSKEEEEYLTTHFPCVSLSEQVLRSETAAICSLYHIKLKILTNKS